MDTSSDHIKPEGVRILDCFEWVHGNVEDVLNENDLRSAALYYRTLNHLYRANGRLKDSTDLTFTGCVSHYWQVVFKELYSKRSDIMHGRMGNVPAEQRLQILGQFQNMLRNVWREVLSSEEHIEAFIEALEGDDESRKKYFEQIGSGYKPPKE